MDNKTDNSNEEDKKSIITSIKSSEIFELNLIGYESRNYDKKTINNVLWADKIGQDIVYKLFILLREEFGYINYLKGVQDTFSRVGRYIYNTFIQELRGKQDIEKVINNKINELKKFKFRTSRGLDSKSEPIDQRFEDITIDQIKDMILSMRNRRISFLEEISNEYKKNTVKYKEFLEKQRY